jgi:hypothetical protein
MVDDLAKGDYFFLQNFKLKADEHLTEITKIFQKNSLLLSKASEISIKQLQENIQGRFQLKLLMRGSEDGFRAEAFHKLCDLRGPSIVAIKVISSGKSFIFGGYTEVPWGSPAAG